MGLRGAAVMSGWGGEGIGSVQTWGEVVRTEARAAGVRPEALVVPATPGSPDAPVR